MPTTNLQVPYISASQAQKEVTANDAFDRFDAALTARLVKSISGADVTLTDDEYNKNIYFQSSGTLSAARNLIVPARKKLFTFEHGSSGGFQITVKTPTGGGIPLVFPQKALLYCDGTNVVLAIANRKSFGYQVEDLAADADIGDGTAANARSIFMAQHALTIHKISILSQGTPAGIDDSNTCVVKCYRGTNAIVTKTYNTATPFPANHAESNLGTLSNNIFAAGEDLRFDVVNGTTANPPPFMLAVEFEPQAA